MARSSDIAVVTISRPDICSAASEPSSGIVMRGASEPASVEGELEQPGGGQPQRELAPDLFHPGPVGVLPGGQGPLVVGRLVGRRDEHPDHQLSRLDGRVVAVLKQHGPPHRLAGEPLLQLVVDDALDLLFLCPFHGASHPCHPLNASRRTPVPQRQHVTGGLRRPVTGVLRLGQDGRALTAMPYRA